MKTPRRTAVLEGGVVVAAGAILEVAAPFLGAYQVSIMVATLLVVGAAVAWNLIGGLGGLIPFGHAAFFGLGAYGAAWALQSGQSIPVAIIVAVVLAAGGAVVIAPSLRARGMYFAIITFALAIALQEVAQRYGPGEPLGLFYEPSFLPNAPLIVALSISGAVGASLLFIAVKASRLGAALRACSLDIHAARSIGVNDLLVNTIGLAISAAIMGYLGSVYALTLGYMDAITAFDSSWSTVPVLACILGGLGSLPGAVIGAVIWSLLTAYFRSQGAGQGITAVTMGLILIVLTITARGGLVALARAIYVSARDWQRRRMASPA